MESAVPVRVLVPLVRPRLCNCPPSANINAEPRVKMMGSKSMGILIDINQYWDLDKDMALANVNK